MNLVYQIHLEPAAGGHVLNVIQQFTGTVDTGARRSIYLNQIHTSTLGNFQAATTFTTRRRSHSAITIEAFSKDSSDGRLACAASTRKQVGVVQAILLQRIHQRSTNMLLAFEFLEIGWSIFSSKNLVTHGDRGRCWIKGKLYGGIGR